MLWRRFQCRHGDGWKGSEGTAKNRLTMSSDELLSFMVQEPCRRKQHFHDSWHQDFTQILDSGRTNQWDHAVHQWDVLVLQTLHVAHNVGLRVVTEETKRKCTFEWKITFTHSKKSQKFSPDWQIFFKLAKKKKQSLPIFLETRLFLL